MSKPKSVVVRISGTAETDGVVLETDLETVDLDPQGNLEPYEREEMARMLAKALGVTVTDKRRLHSCPSCKCKVD